MKKISTFALTISSILLTATSALAHSPYWYCVQQNPANPSVCGNKEEYNRQAFNREQERINRDRLVQLEEERLKLERERLDFEREQANRRYHDSTDYGSGSSSSNDFGSDQSHYESQEKNESVDLEKVIENSTLNLGPLLSLAGHDGEYILDVEIQYEVLEAGTELTVFVQGQRESTTEQGGFMSRQKIIHARPFVAVDIDKKNLVLEVNGKARIKSVSVTLK